MGVTGGEDDFFDGRQCERSHMFSERSGDVVFWDVEVPYMHLRTGVQSFELLQGLISKDNILIDPLVL